MIRQVLVNLLANAARADRSGRLGITVRAGAGEVTIAVWDHGPGIAAAERERLFEPYAGTRPGSGSAGAGVGLAIARGFVDAHGGSIAVAETPGGGATFVVSLPLGEDR
jgi:two-component system sensor histidine kinase KdpD